MASDEKKILLVEDEKAIRDAVAAYSLPAPRPAPRLHKQAREVSSRGGGSHVD